MTQLEAEAHASAMARQAFRMNYRARLHRVLRSPDGKGHCVTCDGRLVGGAATGNATPATDLSGWETVAMFQFSLRRPCQDHIPVSERPWEGD